jgi:hypothetical protein
MLGNNITMVNKIEKKSSWIITEKRFIEKSLFLYREKYSAEKRTKALLIPPPTNEAERIAKLVKAI